MLSVDPVIDVVPAGPAVQGEPENEPRIEIRQGSDEVGVGVAPPVGQNGDFVPAAPGCTDEAHEIRVQRRFAAEELELDTLGQAAADFLEIGQIHVG